MATVPASLGKPVTTRQFSWNEMARRAWGSEFSAPDHRVYEWSNGRGFDSTDKGQTGFYRNYLLAQGLWTADSSKTMDTTQFTADGSIGG